MTLTTNQVAVRRPDDLISSYNLRFGDRHHPSTNGLVTEIVCDLFHKCLSHGDVTGFMALAHTNKHCYMSMLEFLDERDIKQLFSSFLSILDAETLGFKVDDEPCIKTLADKFQLLRCIKDLPFQVENNAGLTLLTMFKGFTLNLLMARAVNAGIIVDVDWDEILKELGNVTVKHTYRVVLTNDVFITSRDETTYWDHHRLVSQIECEMPTMQECVALCIFQKIFNDKVLYGQNPMTYTHTSTHLGRWPLIVGNSSSAYLKVTHAPNSRNSHGCNWDVGVGGRRQLGVDYRPSWCTIS